MGEKRKPSGRLQFVLKDDRDKRVSAGALWTATRRDGTPVRFGDARVFNVTFGDRETSVEEVVDMILSGDYFMSVIVDDD